MKKLFLIALATAALGAVLVTSAFAADTTSPVAPAAQYGYGQGNGIHTPGTGLTNGMGAGQGVRRGAPEWAGDNDDAAAILGLTVEELQAERLAGKSLVEIAAAQGIDEDTLIAKLLDGRKATVAELLAGGKITQAQADYMLSNMAEHVKLQVERTTVGRPAFAGQSPMAPANSAAGGGRTAGANGTPGMGRGRWNR